MKRYANLIRDKWTSALFSITCMAQWMSENVKSNSSTDVWKGRSLVDRINLANFIEEAADLYFLATQIDLDYSGCIDGDGKSLSRLAEAAVEDIRAIWKEYGEWPEELRWS